MIRARGERADALDLKSGDRKDRVGSNPTEPTILSNQALNNAYDRWDFIGRRIGFVEFVLLPKIKDKKRKKILKEELETLLAYDEFLSQVISDFVVKDKLRLRLINSSPHTHTAVAVDSLHGIWVWDKTSVRCQ
jgi:hypothetical protein